MKTNLPYAVLTYYRWPNGGRWAYMIGEDLVNITKRLGFKPLVNNQIKKNEGAAWFSEKDHAEVRMEAVPYSEGTGWHQDGDTTVSREEMDFGLILWASRDPTELKIISKGQEGDKVYQPEAFQLIYIENLKGYHRRPPGLSGRRWHFRQRVCKPS